MIEVLQYVPSFAFGGIETFVLNMNIKLKDKAHFTYLVEKDISEDMKEKIKGLGADIIRIRNLTKESLMGNIKDIYKVFKTKKYDVVHIHGCDIRFWVMLFARFYGIEKRIYHIHSARIERHMKIKKVFLNLNILLANTVISCSRQAANIMCPKKYLNKVNIIQNAIEINNFLFDEKDRNSIRNKFNISKDDLVIGNIGRIEEVKNQIYLLDIVEKFVKENKNNIKLLIIGEGQLRSKLEEECKKKNILKYVIFTGLVHDTCRFYSAMDIFCLPSLCEGLGIVLVEAQANGLHCIASTNVPKEVNITGEVEFLNIEKNNLRVWTEKIEKKRARYNKKELLIKGGYDLNSSSNKLLKIYTNEEKNSETIK